MCNGIALVVLKKGDEIQIYGKPGNGSHDEVLHDFVAVDDHNSIIKLEYIFPGQLRLDAPDKESREAALATGLVSGAGFGDVIRIDPAIVARVMDWLSQKQEMLVFTKELLQEAYLFGANLVRANLVRANLVRANLVRANLSGANLVRADLVGANLSGANLSVANLSGANLVRADLFGANLSGADLSGADLSGANLSVANLSEVRFSEFTLKTLKDARNVQDAILSQAILDALTADDPKKE